MSKIRIDIDLKEYQNFELTPSEDADDKNTVVVPRELYDRQQKAFKDLHEANVELFRLYNKRNDP